MRGTFHNRAISRRNAAYQLKKIKKNMSEVRRFGKHLAKFVIKSKKDQPKRQKLRKLPLAIKKASTHKNVINLLSAYAATSFLNDPPLEFKLKYGVAVFAGISASWLVENTGLSTALHEVVGHGYLGMRLTCDYPAGSGPSYWIAEFEKCQAIAKAGSPGAGIKAFFAWLFVPTGDTAGLAYPGPEYHTNAFVDHIGHENASAWVSLSGSIPGLVVNTSAVIAGMLLRQKYPALGIGLTTFGLVNSCVAGAYACHAAFMSPTTLQANATTGHDFANFAVQMSRVTGLHANLIAAGVALFWIGFIPIIALAIYLYQNSRKTDIVPNDMALKYWLTQLEKNATELDRFNVLLKKYLTEKTSNHGFADDDAQTKDFLKYLMKNLPQKTILDAKKQLLKSWQSLQTPSKLDTFFTYATLSTVILSTITHIMDMFASSTVPALLPVVIILKTILPLLGLISIARSAYETYKDLKCPHSQVPMKAKILSCLSLATTVIMVSLMIVAAFVPGLQFFAIPAALIGTILSLGLSFAKVKETQKAFQATASTTGKVSVQTEKDLVKIPTQSQSFYGSFFGAPILEKGNDLKPMATTNAA
jgi:hypothetical protein